MKPSGRSVVVALHAGRPEAVAAAGDFVRELSARGIACLVKAENLDAVGETSGRAPLLRELTDVEGRSSELVVVFGGDGSILRAAEWALPREVPVLGVNLGHVGFLAELESHETGSLIDHVVNRRYQVEERMSIDTVVRDGLEGEILWGSFAVNEVSLEKMARERMIEVLVRIDGRPLSRWGTDGVLVSTPTGSTAYAFSANGPVIWPDLSALLLVPLSAHALFNRAMVVGTKSRISIELLPAGGGGAVVWCDGRRSFEVRQGMVVEAGLGRRPLRLARMSEQPFVDRLVRKFGLPVDGWRGAAERKAPHAD